MTGLKMHPFVKWAGGKKQLLEQLEDRMPAVYGTYYEPFVGGGALLLDSQPKKAVINDVNEQLINAYKAVKKNTEQVIAAVSNFDAVTCDKEYYLKLRCRYNQKIAKRELDAECAALMIWLNKHCFNGLYRVNARGFFNVPYNNKKSGASIDPESLVNISSYLNKIDIQIRKGDFAQACYDIRPGDFVYFDSPYVPASTTSNFTSYTKDGFTLEDHMRLADLFKKLDSQGVKVLLSNNDVELVRELYQGYRIETLGVKRSINSNASKRSASEVLISNY